MSHLIYSFLAAWGLSALNHAMLPLHTGTSSVQQRCFLSRNSKATLHGRSVLRIYPELRQTFVVHLITLLFMSWSLTCTRLVWTYETTLRCRSNTSSMPIQNTVPKMPLCSSKPGFQPWSATSLDQTSHGMKSRVSAEPWLCRKSIGPRPTKTLSQPACSGLAAQSTKLVGHKVKGRWSVMFVSAH
jgi:hypothetical protein